MKNLPYRISKKAVSDLEEIWTYTGKKWSAAQADRYYSLIFDEIDYICKNIDTGKSMNHIRKGYRASKIKSHLIFYRVVEGTVEIIRILNEKMDIANQFTSQA